MTSRRQQVNDLILALKSDGVWQKLHPLKEDTAMPWTPRDAYRHTKRASTPALQRQWSHVANSELEKTGDEALAIRAANSVVARGSSGGKRRRNMKGT